jgi:iron complex outermembrane receptor protein
VSNWLSGAATGVNADVGGKTRVHSVYAQDVWAFASRWKAVLGARVEQWQVMDGYTRSSALPAPTLYARRKQSFVSPKAALAYEATDSTALKLSVGRAVRMPTVNELTAQPPLRISSSSMTQTSSRKSMDYGVVH